MKKLLLPALLVLSTSAMAQNEKECRGKSKFDLDDGAYGCVLEIKKSGIVSSQTRGTGPGSITTARAEQASPLIAVAMFGDYSETLRISNGRLRKLCKMYKSEADKKMAEESYKRISVIMYWPRLQAKGSNSSRRVRTQGASMNRSCKQVQNFGGSSYN